MKPARWGLYWKTILTILAIGLLPLAGGMLWAGLYGRSVLIEASGVKFAELAKQMASQIDFVLDREVHEAQSLALSEELREAALKKSSDSDPTFTDPASRYLRRYSSLKEGEYEAIFATDRDGRVVASTRPLDQNDHAREDWWKRAYHEGEGEVFLSDLYHGQGDDRLRVDLALPIIEPQTRQAIGVLKLMIKDLDLGDILQGVRIGETGHAMLVGSQGQVLFCPLSPAGVHQPIQVDRVQRSPEGWSIENDIHGGGETISAFSTIPLTARFGPQNPGIQTLRVLVTQERGELFAPIHRALRTTGEFGILLAGVLALLGVFAARRLTRPIFALQKGAEILAEGDLRHRIQIRTGDEIETLGESINRMAQNLEEFEEARLKAERLTALHRLSTLLTHDLRGPMVGILKALTLFRENYGRIPPAQADLLLSDMIRGGELLQGTLNDLLDVYRDSLSAIPLRYTEFSLIKVIDETVRLLDLDARGKGVKLEADLASPELALTADRRRIQRVLFNLLDNAIKHSPPGGIVTLRVCAPADGYVQLYVDDQGKGVPEGELRRIFDFLYEPPAEQIDPDSRYGTGVGLYFCRVTLEAHGGKVWAESCPAGGARFVVDLPLTGRLKNAGDRAC
jgi:signal transduction histidine kinase